MTTQCEICRIEFNAKPYHLKRGLGRFCSMVCRDVWQRTKTAEKTAPWKGDNIGYSGIHWRMKRFYGRADKCENENCKGESTTYEWANLSRRYLLDRSDWKMLCKQCHFQYDFNEEWRNNISKGGKGRIPWNKGLKMTEEQKSKMNISGLIFGRGWNKILP